MAYLTVPYLWPILRIPGILGARRLEENVYTPIDQQRIVSCRYSNAYQYACRYTLLTILCSMDGSESARRKAHAEDTAASCHQ